MLFDEGWLLSRLNPSPTTLVSRSLERVFAATELISCFLTQRDSDTGIYLDERVERGTIQRERREESTRANE